jgi:nitrate/nitrite transporter NarK
MALALTRRGDSAVRAALGLGNGAVFALVGTRVPATGVGSVTGLVFTAWRLSPTR